MCIYVYVYAHMHTCTYMHIHMCAYACVHMCVCVYTHTHIGFPSGSDGKKSACNSGALGLICGL